ncbi:MAG: AtpZ/AtpI family protein [Calditrichaeota bacterium]|nr:AtpZ/AtpI family protein [Calditrichota bacterium]MCB9391611.1 AtpZ/AtpI family protein [Calditrichota bacterium]
MLKDFVPPRQDPLQIGLTIVVSTAVFGLVGWWVDKKIGSFPILMSLGSILGFALSIYRTVLVLRSQDSNSDKS